MRRIVILALSALMVAALAVPALAAPREKGTTTIDASALIGLGVVTNVTGSGVLDGTNAIFGIVGNPSDGTIEHTGGVILSTVNGDIKVRNFTIDLTDLAAPEVTAIVPGVGRAPLFDLVNVDLVAGTADLAVTATASQVIAGDGRLTGAVVGSATIDVQTPGRGR